jgi:CheY-like chemotaxis protein
MIHLLDVSISKKAVMKYNFSDNLPSFDGDVTQIRQIVMNIITNASDAIGEQSGIITLSTGAMHCSADYLATINEISHAGYVTPPTEGLYIFVEVADTGCGMDEATRSRLFDPFFTTKFTGRGLGMAAVLGIVRGHKGVITVQSEVGKGSVFRVLFPENVKEDSADSLLYGNIIEQKWEGEGTILVVDDEETIRAVARSMLEKLGFKVLTASDGDEAVKIFSEHSSEIKCIILDLTMPHLDGVETFERLHSMQYNVKIILCSGYTEQDATERFIGSDLAGFIQKPYNISMLKEALEKIL